MKYGKRLKELRNQKGLSQKELTEKLNLNRSTYARYETSTTQPDFDTLKRIAEFHDVTIDYLLGHSNDPQKTEEEAFEAFRNDPELERWYKELPKNDEEDLQKLRKLWEIVKQDKRNRD